MHIGNLITKQVLHFLYNACGKWYFQSKISPFGLIQAGHTKLENGVSLSMGIVEKIWNIFCDQGANVHLWLNSRMFWFLKLTLGSNEIVKEWVLCTWIVFQKSTKKLVKQGFSAFFKARRFITLEKYLPVFWQFLNLSTCFGYKDSSLSLFWNI